MVVRELVIIEHDPAQGLVSLVGAGRKLAGGVREPDQDRARLRHELPVDFQHRDLAHRIRMCPPARIAGLAAGKVNTHRLPVEAGAIQVKRQLIGVTRGTYAMQLVAGHSSHANFGCATVSPISLARSVFGQSSNSPSSPDAAITTALMVKPVI